jgi:general secretion pathway protein K
MIRPSRLRLQNSGSALIITLLLLAFLTGLVVEFAYGVYIGTSMMSNWGDAQKASLIAKSGQAISAVHIREMRNVDYTSLNNILVPVPHDFGENTLLTVRIEDENAKFNINSIIYVNGRTNEAAMKSLERMFDILGIESSLILSLADWIDPDSEPGSGDSEMNAKNAPLWDIGEMRYVDGIDDEVFDRISPFLTVHGNKMININTAELPVLASLHEDITGALAEKIVDFRDITPFQSMSDVWNMTGLLSFGGNITFKSSYFRVVAQAEVNGTVRTVESVTDTSMKVHVWREG